MTPPRRSDTKSNKKRRRLLRSRQAQLAGGDTLQESPISKVGRERLNLQLVQAYPQASSTPLKTPAGQERLDSRQPGATSNMQQIVQFDAEGGRTNYHQPEAVRLRQPIAARQDITSWQFDKREVAEYAMVYGRRGKFDTDMCTDGIGLDKGNAQDVLEIYPLQTPTRNTVPQARPTMEIPYTLTSSCTLRFQLQP